MSDDNNSGNATGNLPAIEQARPPRNLQDLLRFAVEVGENSNSSQNNNSSGPLDPERRRFLEEALRSMTSDVSQVLAENINILRSVGDSSSQYTLEDYQDALSNLADVVDNIDASNDFFKLGGFEVARSILSSPHSELRWQMADILGQCTQNNPFCQTQAVSMNFIPLLLKMAERDPDQRVKLKCVFAIASTVRDCPEALKQFILADGFSVILKAMQSENESLCTKSTFFISTLINQSPEIKDVLFNMGFVEQLISLIRGEHSRNHEHLTSALLSFVENSKQAEEECKRPEFELRATLQNILDEFAKDEAFQEEISNITRLMAILFTDEHEEER